MPSSSASASFSPPSTYPPSPPSPTAEACAELAALTVRVFSPTVVASVRDIFSSNPRLDPSEHLPLLGTLVVRHVALSLADDDPEVLDDDDEETPQSPVLENLDHRVRNEHRIEIERLRSTPPANRRLPRDLRRRGSYRDVAYNAVRQKRIVPESLPVENEDTANTSTAQTRPVRRLSIRSIRLPKDAAMRKTKSVAAMDSRKWRTGITGHDLNRDDRVLRRRHSPSFWNEDSGRESFPRADLSTSIQIPSTRPLRSENSPTLSKRRENRGKEGSPSGQSRIANRTAPISKLVQLRKQRLEKRGKPIR